MKVIETALEGVVILEPELHRDARGYFFESYSQQLFDKSVRPVRFVQDNESRSSYGVLRGLHFQRGEHAQGKLVRVVEGAVLDVAVDIRRGSPTFGRYVAVELSGENHRQLFIPRGFAHGFAVLSPRALFQYKCDAPYAPQSEGAIAWNDPQIGIDWRLDPADVLLSERTAAIRDWMRRPNCSTITRITMPNDKTAAAQAPATAEKTAGAAPDTAATTAKTAPATTPPTATAGSATLPGTGRRTAAITVLVTGANGQLGNEMRRIAATDATTAPAAATAPGNVRYLFTDVAELDITDPQAVRRTMRENDVEVDRQLRRIHQRQQSRRGRSHGGPAQPPRSGDPRCRSPGTGSHADPHLHRLRLRRGRKRPPPRGRSRKAAGRIRTHEARRGEGHRRSRL